MDEATELKLLEEMLLVGKDDGIHLDDVEVSTIDYESALQVVAAAFHSESRSFPLIANRGAPSSFKGRAAVDWMVDHFLLKKRGEAVFIGQTLMDRQIVKLRPKKTLLDDLISANKDSKAKDSSRGEAEVEIGVFADADDKHYMFQKAPLMMENYIRKHLPISVAQLLKDYPPPPRAGATSPPPASSSSSSASSSPFLSPRARAATSFSLAAMTRSSSSRSFTELPIPSSSSPSPSSSSSSSSSFPATTSSPSTASTSKPFIRRHGRSASVTLTGSSLTVPLKHNTNNGDSASPLASPTASPRKISKARRASLVLKEKFLIFRENRLDKSDGGGLDDKEEWERGGYGDGSHTHRNQHNNNSNNDSNSINHSNSSSDSDSDESSSSDDSSDTSEAALPAAAAAKSSNHGSGMLSIPSARRRASMLFSPLRLGKDSSSSSSLAVSEEANRDVVVKKVVVARRLLDENGEWSSAADGERESTSTSTSSNSSSPRTSSSSTTTSASTSSRPGSPIMPPPSPRTQLTLDKLREAAGAKKAGVQGRLRGKSSADLVKTSNPLYGTAALDLEEMVREREERNREKHERREARRVRREERRRRRAERAEAAAAAGVVVKEAAHVDEGRSRGGSSEGDHPSSSPSTSTSASPARSPRPRSPNRGRTSADRDSITFAATVDNDDDDRAAAGSAGGGGGGKQRRSSDGMILTLQGQAKKKANSVDKKDTRLDQEAGTDSPIKPARQSRLRRASSLRVSSGNLLLGRSSSDKKEKEKEKEKEKDKIKKMTVVDSGGGGGGSSVNKKEDDKRHRRKGGSFIKPRASRDELDTVVGGGGGGKQSPEQHPRSAVVRELAADVDSMAADKSKRKRNLTPHSVALPLAQRMSVGVRSRSATLDVVDSSDEGEGGAAPPASNTSPGVAKKAATSTMTTTGGD